MRGNFCYRAARLSEQQQQVAAAGMAPCPSSYGGFFTLGTAIILVICYLRAAVLDSNFKIRPRFSGQAHREHDVSLLERIYLVCLICVISLTAAAAAAAAAATASIKASVFTAGWRSINGRTAVCNSGRMAVDALRGLRLLFSSKNSMFLMIV